uniref:Retrovirus-related Pol polyprotein from transposon TNT 1-94 n=1 Tax=Tanacetum cinerariifolium TaxID=118510 RepID=A0A6L2JB43_TANCI|nr:retrovirus-related Pol polyprotein from transposon TNT 1-94 [Tanacetum cinerariifolium]
MRWQKKMNFFLTSMNVVYVKSTQIPDGGDDATMESIKKRSKWENDDYVCRGLIHNSMSDTLFDIYQNFKYGKELRDSLETKYTAEDASSTKFLAQEIDKPKSNNVVGTYVVNMVEHNNSTRQLKGDCKCVKVSNKTNALGTNGSWIGSNSPMFTEHMIVAGAENRPPMLDKSMYDSWQSRMFLYNKGKKNGRMMLESIENGPLVYPTIEENGKIRDKKYVELTEQEQLQDDCDVQATNIVLQGLLPDVYSLVNHCKTAKDIWNRVKLRMQRTELLYQERECKLYNEFKKLTSVKQPPVEFPQIDSRLAVLVFLPGDDLIACLNKAMAFMSTVIASRFSSTNNQLITSLIQETKLPFRMAGLLFNKFKEDRVKFCWYENSGKCYKFRGNNVGGQAMGVKCYNYQGEGHMARQYTRPKRTRNSTLFKEKMLLVQAHKAGQTNDLDAFDSDCDDISLEKAVLMVNLSSYDSDVLYEVTQHETYQNDDMHNQNETIDSAFARFNTIITILKALDKGYSSKNYVRKFLRTLHPKWKAKVMTIKESKELTSLSLDELIENLKVHEMIIKIDSEIVKAKGERKSLALKAKKIFLREEIKDSRCSKLMTDNRKLFLIYKAYNEGNVISGSNLRGNIIGKGYSQNSKAYIILNKPTKKVKESLNVTSDKTPPPSKTSPLVDDDLDEEEAIKVTEKKNLENDIKDETLEINEIVNIKESKNHSIEDVIGNLNQRTLRSKAKNQISQPRNMTIIGTKWVFRNKLDENGIVSRNMDRLVAQGYNQQEGIDYDETYASVSRLESIRILLSYACALDFKLFQMDVKNTFLNGFINEEVYVAQPPGFIDFENLDHVYKLKKALYGLKQATKAWPDIMFSVSKRLPKPLNLKRLSVSSDTLKALCT